MSIAISYFVPVRPGVWTLSAIDPPTPVTVNGWAYEAEPVKDADCHCRRCLIHNDPAGCLVRYPA